MGEIKVIMGSTNPDPVAELTLTAVKQMHSGLLIPNQDAIIRLTREVLRCRGEKEPDLI